MAGVLIGVSEIMAATTTFEMTIALLDMGIAGADLTMSLGLEDKLAKTADGRNFLDKWNKFILIYFGTRAYTELMGLAREMRKSATTLNDEEFFNIIRKIDLDILNENTIFKQIIDDIVSGDIPRILPNILTIEEQAIVRFYTTDEGYRNFNAALRGEIPMSDFFEKEEYYLNIALNKLPKLTSNVEIYRGTGKPEIDFYRSLKEGDSFKAEDFMSFSTDEEEALSFYYRRQKQTGEAAIVKIKSKSGVPIHQISDLSTEAEILYMSKTKFKFIKMRTGIVDYQTLDTGLIIEIEEL